MVEKMKKSLIPILLILANFSKANSQILLTEIFPNPTGSDNQKEFVEIYNFSSQSIDLAQWKISDNTSTDTFVETGNGFILPPNQFCIILENDYNLATGIYNGIIPDSTLILKVDDATIGNGLLNTSETVSILDDQNNAVNNFTYNNVPENFTIEKVEFANPNSTEWKISKIEQGTPGFKNSISPKSFDLELTEFALVENLTSHFEVNLKIKNLGTSSADSFEVSFFVEGVFDQKKIFAQLSDSLTINFEKNSQLNFGATVLVKIDWAKDEDQTNNEKFLQIPFERGVVLFNEILSSPESGKPEWIELVNATNQKIDLAGWQIQDASGTVIPLSNNFLENEFLVFAEGQTDFPNQSCFELPINWTALNNSSETLLLLDLSGQVIDSISYDSETWDIQSGKSLERINLEQETNEPTNWKSSLADLGGTPCEENSFAGLQPNQKGSVLFSEFLPAPNLNEAEWFELFNNTQNEVNLKGWFVESSSGNKMFLKSNLSTTEFLAFSDTSNLFTNYPQNVCTTILGDFFTLPNTNGTLILKDYFGVTIDSFTYTSNWEIETGISLERINYAIEATDSTIWKQSLAVVGGTPCESNSYQTVKLDYESNDLKINEVMFSPFSGIADYFEVFNTLPTEIQLNGWKVAKTNGDKGLRLFPKVILPNDFVIITKDSSIFKIFPEAEEKTLILPNLFSLTSSDTIQILTPLEKQIDFLAYDENFGGGTGISIEKINPSLENTSENWSSSVRFEGGTPGFQNSIFQEVSQSEVNFDVSISPNPFSPDSDGFEDQAVISWQTNETSLTLDIEIFDVKGRKIRQLANAEIVGGKSSKLWDGKNDDGKVARIGRYIILFKAKNSQGTKILQKKKTIVLAKKL
ncbi:MAG: hypothetical protein DWQ06_09170 [Calditrichaeota bacterium]|nr:MAG: hypothetical protein DWQ06_09170 [Calditrichota bacterium]